LRRRGLRKGERAFFPIIKLRERDSRGCFPSASDAGQAISWRIMAIVTPVDTVASRGTSGLKQASEACARRVTSPFEHGIILFERLPTLHSEHVEVEK